MKEKRDETIILRLSKTEKNRIYEKMLSMGIRSLSAYMRLLSQRIPTENTFTIILFTTPLR